MHENVSIKTGMVHVKTCKSQDGMEDDTREHGRVTPEA